MDLSYHPGQQIDPNNLDLSPLSLTPNPSQQPREPPNTIIAHPDNANLSSQTAPHSPDLPPRTDGFSFGVELEGANTLWVTVDLDEHMQYIDGLNLLRFVATEIQEGRAVVDERAQHDIRPRCLSTPLTVVCPPYRLTLDQTFERVRWWFEEAGGQGYLDRGVLFGPR
ncbi:hypothetical protein N7535_001482 [Penicillium sp. DV-2018c]|nr:hypothetical protein N7535_001482 [Penicillium sp. DV-2018c]